MPGYFVTATDTGVGKTVVTAALAMCLHRHRLRVLAMKPVETGCTEASQTADGDRLHRVTPHLSREQTCLYRLPAPLAPLAAARESHLTLDVERILATVRNMVSIHDVVLVEGVGGALVPLASRYDVRSLMRDLGLPVLVVSRAALGSVNHTLLTLEALEREKIRVTAVILNQPRGQGPDELLQMESTVVLLRELIPMPLVGPLPFDSNLSVDWDAGIARLSCDVAITTVAESIVQATR